MTTIELQERFEALANYHDSLSNIRKTAKLVDIYLKDAERAYINKRLKGIGSGIKDLRQKSVDEIRPITVKNQNLNIDGNLSTDQIKVYDLPDNYMFLIGDRSTTNYCNKDYKVQNRLYVSEEEGEILNGTHTKPHYKSPVSQIYDNKLYVYRDNELTFDIKNVIIDYVRKYQPIDLFEQRTSELDDSVHPDIVSLAITIFLDAVESRRFNTNLQKAVNITEQVN